MSTTPHYWVYETTGALARVIERYLISKPLNEEEIAIMRAYLRQWIMAPQWANADELRASVLKIRNNRDIERWLDAALDQGIDPL
jgi:hypothetical protein